MITAVVVGDQEVIARLRQIPDAVRGSMRKAINALAFRLSNHVKTNKLSGQVLRNRSGRLRRSINPRINESKDSITGIVGTNVEYAAFHEFGFTGTVNVREHVRTLKSGTRQTVSAHQRDVNYPARSFRRSALRDMTPDIKKELRTALSRGVREVIKW